MILSVLLLAVVHAIALPTISAPLKISSFQLSSSNLSAPPDQPTCDNAMGVTNYEDCNAAIGMLPRDARGRPVLRNFYTDPADESSTMPNVLVPLEETHGKCSRLSGPDDIPIKSPGSCTAQVLLATNFNDVPHDQSSWIDLVGPLRIILRQCARGKGTGGVIVRNGLCFEQLAVLVACSHHIVHR